MAALLTTGNWDPSEWRAAFADADPGRTIHVHGRDDYDPQEIRYALTWKPPPGLMATLPNLEVIFNLGAGVDGVLADPSLPDVPIVRLVDPDLTDRMAEWVVLQVLTHHRSALAFAELQRKREWRPLRQPKASEVRVGMMGFGVLGAAAARVLLALGFEVHAWSRSHKPCDVPLHTGDAGMTPFLGATDILVVLLPLTDDTRGIIGRTLISRLAQDGALGGPVVINAGRGGLQDEAAIDEALRDGTLKGASLDVFVEEPLPAASPLWSAPNLVITPHVSAVSSPPPVSRYVAAQMAAYERGETLTNVIDRERGY